MVQSVSSAFTAEERDTVRSIAHSLQVSWKKDTNIGNRTFTIGVSLIGGNDGIGINPGAIGGASIYNYFDESEYVMSLAWEHGLKMPAGGLTKAMAEAEIDNTSGRFTPRYMGGNSELFTSVLPSRPFMISAGFEFEGIDQTVPEFAGVGTRQPRTDARSKRLLFQGADYVDFFQNRYLDQEIMFTAQFTGQVIETLFQSLGMSTSQYEVDQGINIIPFGLFEKGTRFDGIIDDLAQAEYGHVFQDETGKFKFWDRQHWDTAPYNSVQRLLLTGQVINAEAPDTDHLINVVEVNAPIRQKQPAQTIFNLPPLSSFNVPSNSFTEQFFEFQDPVLALTDPTSSGTVSYFVANSLADGTGTDVTASITVKNVGTFAKSVKYRFQNNSASTAYITQLVLSGRVAKQVGDLYYREKDDSSVTAYQEHPYKIDNPYIQNASWAASLSRMLLNDFSDIENLQKLTIRAIPELQNGDLISWQGRYWRVYNIRSKLDPDVGFVQDIMVLQRTITTYFRIGMSTIGGSDKIAP